MPRVRFIVPELPPQTPPGALYLTGHHRDWADDPGGWTFRREGAGAVLDAELAEGTLLGVKVRLRRDDGQTVEEGDAWGGRTPEHAAVVRGDLEMTLPIAGWQDGRQGKGRPSRSEGPSETYSHAAPWGAQSVRVWQPEGASGPLPTLILHDGHNVFDEAPTFAGESWDAAGAARSLGVPVRLVALPVNDERNRRYVPFPFELNNFDSGADEYLNWIGDVLLPDLAARYGLPPASHLALAGSSFGGLITLYAGLRDPGRYGTLGVFSPAIWPAEFALRRWMAGRADPAARVWLDMGDHEGSTLAGAAEIVALTHDLAADLRPHVREVHVTIGEGHWHTEAAWRARLPAFLRWWLAGR